MYHAISVERERVAPVKYLTITFDSKTLREFEEFLREAEATTMLTYPTRMLANIKAMKGY